MFVDSSNLLSNSLHFSFFAKKQGKFLNFLQIQYSYVHTIFVKMGNLPNIVVVVIGFVVVVVIVVLVIIAEKKLKNKPGTKIHFIIFKISGKLPILDASMLGHSSSQYPHCSLTGTLVEGSIWVGHHG